MEGQHAVEYPVVSVYDIGPFHVDDPCQVPHTDGIGEGQVMLTFTCVNAWKVHRHRAEPVHSHSGGEDLGGGRAGNALCRDSHLVPPRGEDVAQVEYVPFLTADIGREELGSEQNAHREVALY